MVSRVRKGVCMCVEVGGGGVIAVGWGKNGLLNVG